MNNHSNIIFQNSTESGIVWFRRIVDRLISLSCHDVYPNDINTIFIPGVLILLSVSSPGVFCVSHVLLSPSLAEVVKSSYLPLNRLLYEHEWRVSLQLLDSNHAFLTSESCDIVRVVLRVSVYSRFVVLFYRIYESFS